MGVVLESPQIAGMMRRTLITTTPDYAYKVTLNRHNKLRWQNPRRPQNLLERTGSQILETRYLQNIVVPAD